MLDPPQHEGVRPSELRENSIELKIGVIGLISSMIFSVVSFWLLYEYYVDVFLDVVDWEFWSLAFAVQNTVSASCIVLMSVGYFGFLRLNGSRYSLVYVLALFAPIVTSTYYYGYFGVGVGQVLVAATALGLLALKTFILWQARASVSNRGALTVLVALMVGAFLAGHLLHPVLFQVFVETTTPTALNVTLVRAPTVAVGLLVNITALMLFAAELRKCANMSPSL